MFVGVLSCRALLKLWLWLNERKVVCLWLCVNGLRDCVWMVVEEEVVIVVRRLEVIVVGRLEVASRRRRQVASSRQVASGRQVASCRQRLPLDAPWDWRPVVASSRQRSPVGRQL